MAPLLLELGALMIGAMPPWPREAGLDIGDLSRPTGGALVSAITTIPLIPACAGDRYVAIAGFAHADDGHRARWRCPRMLAMAEEGEIL
ncbi:hypothetical protein WMF31_02550 [Sorangium sp. So ce1036]|uniref:hypothetical protein n=1 Tax=Sorangium sp. So ce1036 TaxID=3133328 RepID=UPI003EFCE55F